MNNIEMVKDELRKYLTENETCFITRKRIGETSRVQATYRRLRGQQLENVMGKILEICKDSRDSTLDRGEQQKVGNDTS